ncbi:TPA: hypothetical protein EYO57_21385 [Candidatus Poribacteria bacterium]|nr:hypothetical protein [Candidatus Poribacteria bacterium]
MVLLVCKPQLGLGCPHRNALRRGYSECPSCIPARRVLMTGAAPAANGAVGFKSTQWNPPHTLAGELSRAGYQTEMIGKLHLTPIRRRYGFDHMQLADATRGDHNDYVEWLQQYHQRNEVHPGMAHGISSNGWIGRPRTTCPKNRCIPFGVLIERWTSCENAIRPSRFSSTFPLLTSTFDGPRRGLTNPRPNILLITTDQQRGDWAPEFDGPRRGLTPMLGKFASTNMTCAVLVLLITA